MNSQTNLTCLTPDQKWLRLWLLNFTKKNHEPGSWAFASRKPQPQVGGKLQPDAVLVMARYYPDPKHVRLIIIKEYRCVIGDYEYGFCAGLVNENEAIVDAAKREMREETGYFIEKIEFISPAIVSSAGLSDESVVIIGAVVGKDGGKQHLEDTEEIEVLELDVEQVERLVWGLGEFKGAKISAKAWPMLYSFVQEENLKKPTGSV